MLRGLVLLGINRRGDFYVCSRQDMVFKRIGTRFRAILRVRRIDSRDLWIFLHKDFISMNRDKSLGKLFIFVNFFGQFKIRENKHQWLYLMQYFILGWL